LAAAHRLHGVGRVPEQPRERQRGGPGRIVGGHWCSLGRERPSSGKVIGTG